MHILYFSFLHFYNKYQFAEINLDFYWYMFQDNPQADEIDLNSYNQQNEAKVTEIDQRIKVLNPLAHPYISYGRVVSKVYDKNHNLMKLDGTGCIIDSKLVLTSAHLLHHPDLKQSCDVKLAEQVFFYPIATKKGKNQNNEGIRVKKHIFNHQYFSKVSDKKQRYDIAILVLDTEENIFDQNQILNLSFNFTFDENKKRAIQIVGFDKVGATNLYYESAFPKALRQTFLTYLHTTDQGHSGSGVLTKNLQQKYQIVGVHKGAASTYNYCALLTAFKGNQQILTEAIEQYGLQDKWSQIYIPSLKVFKQHYVLKIETLIKQNLQLKQQNFKLKQELKLIRSELQEKNCKIKINQEQLKQKIKQPTQKNHELIRLKSQELIKLNEKPLTSRKSRNYVKQNKSFYQKSLIIDKSSIHSASKSKSKSKSKVILRKSLSRNENFCTKNAKLMIKTSQIACNNQKEQQGIKLQNFSKRQRSKSQSKASKDYLNKNMFEEQKIVQSSKQKQKIVKRPAQFTNLHIKTSFDKPKLHEISQNVEYSILKQSSIVNAFQELQKLLNFISKPIQDIKLIFSAKKNNFKCQKFYQSCANEKNILIICKTNKDKIIGAFTPLSFDVKQINQKWPYVKDESGQSFIFSLTNNHKFSLKNRDKAICLYMKKAFVEFGSQELFIANDAHIYSKCQTKEFNTCYQNKLYKKDNKQSYLSFNGNQTSSFKLKEWEAWKVSV